MIIQGGKAELALPLILFKRLMEHTLVGVLHIAIESKFEQL